MRQSQKAANLRASHETFRTPDFVHENTQTWHVSRFISFFLSYTLEHGLNTAESPESRPLLQSEWPVLDLAQGWFHKVHPDLNEFRDFWRPLYHALYQALPSICSMSTEMSLLISEKHPPNHVRRTTTHLCRGVVQLGQFLHIGSGCGVFWHSWILETQQTGKLEAPLSSPTTWAEHMLPSCRYRSWRKL